MNIEDIVVEPVTQEDLNGLFRMDPSQPISYNAPIFSHLSIGDINHYELFVKKLNSDKLRSDYTICRNSKHDLVLIFYRKFQSTGQNIVGSIVNRFAIAHANIVLKFDVKDFDPASVTFGRPDVLKTRYATRSDDGFSKEAGASYFKMAIDCIGSRNK